MTSLLTTKRTSTINGNAGTTLAIGNNLTTNAIQIGTSTNSISIGATGCTTTIGATGSSTIIGGLLQTSTINGVSGSSLSIGNNLTTSAIQIGTSTNSISIGATGCTTTIGATGSSTIIGGLLQTSTINGVSGSSLTIGNNLTTEQIRIGGTNTNIIIQGSALPSRTLSVSGNIITTGGTTTTGLILTGGNITLSGGVPTSTQYGYTISTTSVNTYSSTGYNQLRFNITQTGSIGVQGATGSTVFSNNDGSGYYGILLVPGTWLIDYNLTFSTDSAASTWVDYAYSEIMYNPTISSLGTLTGTRDIYSFYSAVNYGYQLGQGQFSEFSMNGFTVEQIPTNRYYNVYVVIYSAAPNGNLIVNGNLTAVRIA